MARVGGGGREGGVWARPNHSAQLCPGWERIKMSPLITTGIYQGGRLCVVPVTKQRQPKLFTSWDR